MTKTWFLIFRLAWVLMTLHAMITSMMLAYILIALGGLAFTLQSILTRLQADSLERAGRDRLALEVLRRLEPADRRETVPHSDPVGAGDPLLAHD